VLKGRDEAVLKKGRLLPVSVGFGTKCEEGNGWKTN
jgi:hypothetical protein